MNFGQPSFFKQLDRTAEVSYLFMGAIQQRLSRFGSPLALGFIFASIMSAPNFMRIAPEVVELLQRCTDFLGFCSTRPGTGLRQGSIWFYRAAIKWSKVDLKKPLNRIFFFFFLVPY